MPIDYKEYHPKWSLISRLIRFFRAKNKCEWCGAPNGAIGYRERGKFIEYPHLGRFDREFVNDTWALKGIRLFKVVLTVAHLDHDKTNNRFWNLKALCQKCHLGHDIKHHVFNRKYGRKTKYLNGKLF